MSSRMKFTQLILEAMIPILGFFYWEWNLYFILLFYLLDLLADEVLMYLKSRDVLSVHELSRKIYLFPAISLVLLLISVAGIHVAMKQIHPDMDFGKEIVRFWTYEEMGIQQGIILIPLIILTAVQRYRMEFKLPGHFKQITYRQLWNPHIRQFYFIIGATLLIYIVNLFFIPAEIYLMLALVGGIVTFKLLRH